MDRNVVNCIQRIIEIGRETKNKERILFEKHSFCAKAYIFEIYFNYTGKIDEKDNRGIYLGHSSLRNIILRIWYKFHSVITGISLKGNNNRARWIFQLNFRIGSCDSRKEGKEKGFLINGDRIELPGLLTLIGWTATCLRARSMALVTRGRNGW